MTVLLAILAVRDGGATVQGQALAALSISVSAQAIAALPILRVLPEPVYAVTRVIGAPNVGLLWWFCLVLLRDDFRRRRVEWAGMVALSFAPVTYLLALVVSLATEEMRDGQLTSVQRAINKH